MSSTFLMWHFLCRTNLEKNRSQVKSSHYKFVHPNFRPSFCNNGLYPNLLVTLSTPGVDIIELQDWEPLGGYTREYVGTMLYEPLVTVSPGCPRYGILVFGLATRPSMRL